jgi:hypothetical protein
MAQRLFVTIAGRGRKDRVLLEVPGEAPIRDWIRDLAQVAGWKELAASSLEGFQLETEEGERLGAEESLLGAGINSSDLLYITACEVPVPSATEGEAAAALEERASPAEAQSTGISISDINRRTRLTGPQGLVILIGQPPLSIGRAGKGSVPDIDLSEWDPKVIVSRKHAVLEKAEDGFSLRPEKTTNGTFLNGVEVPAGESRTLCDGDHIQFGFGGLELVFEAPEG